MEIKNILKEKISCTNCDSKNYDLDTVEDKDIIKSEDSIIFQGIYCNKCQLYFNVEVNYEKELKEKGFKNWDETDLLLIPGNYFKIIPQGFKVEDIFGKSEKFDKNTSDEDCRFGCLSYGVRKDNYGLIFNILSENK